jgi:hypothetical protein
MEEKRSIWTVIGPLIGVALLYFAITSVINFYRAGVIQIEIDELVAKHVENVTQEPAAPAEQAPAVAPGDTAAVTGTVTLTETAPITESTALTETVPLTETTAVSESATLTETAPITESTALTETAPLTETTPITETTP